MRRPRRRICVLSVRGDRCLPLRWPARLREQTSSYRQTRRSRQRRACRLLRQIHRCCRKEYKSDASPLQTIPATDQSLTKQLAQAQQSVISKSTPTPMEWWKGPSSNRVSEEAENDCRRIEKLNAQPSQAREPMRHAEGPSPGPICRNHPIQILIQADWHTVTEILRLYWSIASSSNPTKFASSTASQCHRGAEKGQQ